MLAPVVMKVFLFQKHYFSFMKSIRSNSLQREALAVLFPKENNLHIRGFL